MSLVSIMMITYNHELYIKDAILGVLNQETKFEYELIIANDCSTDKTEEVIEAILSTHPKASLIKYTKHLQNKGMVLNFKWALEQCKGDYIALCEGDDYWTDPLKLQKQFDFLTRNDEFVMCFHKVHILKTNGLIVPDFITTLPPNFQNRITLLKNRNYIHTCSVMFKNLKINLPDILELTPEVDYLFYIILTQYGKIGYLESSMSIYRHDVGILSRSKGNYFKNIMLVNLIALKLTNNKVEYKILLDKNIDFVLNNFAHNLPFNTLITNLLKIPKRFYLKYIFSKL
jgi:glycosyltransferase involved in cell wall biosynthesis